MAKTCNPCVDNDIVMYPIPCNRVQSTRKGGIKTLFLLKCSAVINDLTDEAEWSALKASGDLVVFPDGSGEIPQPETTEESLDGCSPPVVIDETSSVTYATKLFDNDNYLDFDAECQIKNNYGSYTLGWLGCDGILYYDSTFVAGNNENPFFYNFSPKVWRTSTNGNLQTLNVEAKFNTYGTCIKGIALPQAVLNVLYA